VVGVLHVVVAKHGRHIRSHGLRASRVFAKIVEGTTATPESPTQAGTAALQAIRSRAVGVLVSTIFRICAAHSEAELRSELTMRS
jgi:hypothetical protein